MLLKFIEEKYMITARIEDCSSLVQKALDELGLKNVVVEKEVSPRYLLVKYSPGWVGKALEIEFLFMEREDGTEVSIKWPYAKEVPSDNEHSLVFRKEQEEGRQKTERLIMEFKRLIGAKDITIPEEKNVTREK
jgi:hypothetical protein